MSFFSRSIVLAAAAQTPITQPMTIPVVVGTVSLTIDGSAGGTVILDKYNTTGTGQVEVVIAKIAVPANGTVYIDKQFVLNPNVVLRAGLVASGPLVHIDVNMKRQ
jgi:hypothetical protein